VSPSVWCFYLFSLCVKLRGWLFYRRQNFFDFLQEPVRAKSLRFRCGCFKRARQEQGVEVDGLFLRYAFASGSGSCFFLANIETINFLVKKILHLFVDLNFV
jgi:hypothetical protein